MPKSLAEHLAEVRRAITQQQRKVAADVDLAASIAKLDAILPCPRPLTKEEAQLVSFLVEYSTNSALVAQGERLTVYKECTCGCPTIGFALDSQPTSAKGERIISDFFAVVDGEEVGVMLFEQEGRLSTLELYSCSGALRHFGLPRLDTLRPV